MKSTFFAAAAFLVGAVSAFPNPAQDKANCEATYGKRPCGSTKGVSHTVVKGETLGLLAFRFRTGFCDISHYNNITDDKIDNIFPGQHLIIPENCAPGKADNTTCVKNAVQATGTQTCVKGLLDPSYTVLPQDTTTLIANNFNLTVNALEAVNPQIKNFDIINPGDKFVVPVCQGCSCQNEKHTVVSGDTFSALSTKQGTTVGQIESANPGVVPTALQIGQVINNPKCGCVA